LKPGNNHIQLDDEMQFITNNNFLNLLEKIHDQYDIFVPVKKEQTLFYTKYSPPMNIIENDQNTDQDTIIIGEVRAFEPLKLFYTRARECVAEGFKTDIPRRNPKPFCIVGAKACDLKGFQVQDFVFKEGEFEDPFYIRERENNLIISADCTCAIDTCFCLALNGKTYPENNFDLNLSQVTGGFIVEDGSEKGKVLINNNSQLFSDPMEKTIAERDALRKKVTDAVKKNIKEHGIPLQDQFNGIIRENYESNIWKDEAQTCVECGACNTICPTCHCFLLYDQMSEKRMERLRVWDSCMIKDFAKVAAGVNPRELLWMRLRNRFEKKFDFFPQLAGIYACTGCGRCISACPAKIDIREVLQRLVKDAQKQPV
jgi:sulfhydrogenase subunit beta (sulfur reductase)